MPLRIAGWMIGLSLPVLWWVNGELDMVGGWWWLIWSVAVMFVASILMRSYIGAYLVPLFAVIVTDILEILIDGWDTFVYDSGLGGQVFYDVITLTPLIFVALLGTALGLGIRDATHQKRQAATSQS